VFPLWLKPTDALARDMIAAGMEAHLAVVDLRKLPASFAGRRFDAGLLVDLPAGTDPCGENGEFHSFVSAGPMLMRKIEVRVGNTVERDGFAFADLLAAGEIFRSSPRRRGPRLDSRLRGNERSLG
jgi:diphthamide synthase (EF-2-diphthine--ammonia ligase)